MFKKLRGSEQESRVGSSCGTLLYGKRGWQAKHITSWGLGRCCSLCRKAFATFLPKKKDCSFLRPIPEAVCPLPLGRKTSSLFRVSSLNEFQPHQSSRKDGIVKPMVLPVVVYECESWTIKKAER